MVATPVVENSAKAMPCEVSSMKDASETAILAVNAIDYYHHVKCDDLREYLENNTLDTVFDFEEDPAKFNHVYMLDGQGIICYEDQPPEEKGTVILIEYDERM